VQVWRSRECDELYAQLRPAFELLPPSFQTSRSFHLGIHAARPPLQLLRALKRAAAARGGRLSVETYTACDAPPPQQALTELLAAVDVFSPNAVEAESVVGPGSAEQLVERLLAAGAGLVALRRGPEGALVACAATGEAWQVSCAWQDHLCQRRPQRAAAAAAACGNPALGGGGGGGGGPPGPPC